MSFVELLWVDCLASSQFGEDEITEFVGLISKSYKLDQEKTARKFIS